MATATRQSELEVRPRWVSGAVLAPVSADRLHITGEQSTEAVVRGVNSATLGWLEQLDGTREWCHQITEATARGIERNQAEMILVGLYQAGLVEDAFASVAGMPTDVLILGDPALAAAIARLVPGSTSAGTVVHPTDLDAGDLVFAALKSQIVGARVVVLALRRPLASSVEVAVCDRLLMEAKPHLVVGAGVRDARVGPFVVPSRTSCLRCDDLDRRDSVEDWEWISQHLALAPDGPVDPVLAALAAAEAARQLRDLIVDGQPRRPIGEAVGAWDGVVEISAGASARTRRPLQRHRACGCWWA